MLDCAPHFSVVADGTSGDDDRLEGFHLFPSDEVMYAYADYFAYYLPGANYDLLGAPSPDCGPHPDERPPAWLMGLAHLVLYCWGIFLFLLYGTRAKFVDQWTVAFKQATRRTNSFLDGLSPRPTPDQPRMTFFQSNPSAARPAGGEAAKAAGVELKDAKDALTPPHRPSDQVAHAVKVARGLHAVRDVRKPPAPAPQPGSGVV